MTYSQIETHGVRYRGRIINHAINLERIMDGYLAAFFCKDKDRQRDLHLLILGNERMNFESKRQVFLQVIKKYKHPIFLDHPDIAKEIEKIIQERNILAHYLLDFGPEANELPVGTIRFHKLKNDHSHIVFSAVDIDNLYKNIDDLLVCIASYLDNYQRPS